MALIDLHAHTKCSDGTVTPTELVHAARDAGLVAIALTDHDTTEGLAEARRAAEATGVELIDGCEISTRIPEGSVHMLAYGFDVDDVDLQTFLGEVRDARDRRNERMLERLAALGYGITMEEVARHVEGTIVARPHFVDALISRGYFEDGRDVYAQLLGDGKPGYVMGDMPHPIVAIRRVHEAGGVTVVAHPRQIRIHGRGAYRAFFEGLRDAGLGGIEVAHPSHKDRDRRLFQQIADELGLVASAGSDFHGTHKPTIALGSGDGTIRVPYETWERLRARRSGDAA